MYSIFILCRAKPAKGKLMLGAFRLNVFRKLHIFQGSCFPNSTQFDGIHFGMKEVKMSKQIGHLIVLHHIFEDFKNEHLEKTYLPFSDSQVGKPMKLQGHQRYKHQWHDLHCSLEYKGNIHHNLLATKHNILLLRWYVFSPKNMVFWEL